MNTLSAGKNPPLLARGDRIRIISPAGPVAPNSLTNAVSYLEDLGYVVDIGRHAYENDEFLAGSDESRVEDLVEAFTDKKIRAIICSRGGYGSERLLHLVPWDLIRCQSPKIFVGFSDIGAFQTALWHNTGWASFSGLQAVNGFVNPVNTLAKRQFISSISENWRGPLKLDHSNSVILEPVISGEIRGLFLPICLSILTSLIGTSHLPDLKGVILCLEDVGEAPYRIDRLFWQLANSNSCNDLKGVILGTFIMDGQNITESTTKSAKHHLNKFNFPIWQGMPYGHFEDRLTLPFGVNSNVDSNGRVFFE